MSVSMSCHLTSTHFHLLRVLAGRAERSAARETIFLQGARLCLWTAHPEPAQRHRAHASGIERSAWHLKKSGGGVGSRKQLSQGHPPQSVDCPGRQRAGLSFGHEDEEIRALWKAAHQKVLLDESWLSVLLSQPPAPSAQGSVAQSGGAQVAALPLLLRPAWHWSHRQDSVHPRLGRSQAEPRLPVDHSWIGGTRWMSRASLGARGNWPRSPSGWCRTAAGW